MNYKFMRHRIKWALYGLTHFKCRQCRGKKGLSLRRNCSQCCYKNLMHFLETE